MKKVIVLILFLFYLNASAQEYDNDARLWLNIYLEKELGKHFTLHLNQKNRFDQNISRFELGYADFGVTYKFNKHVKIMADYVYVLEQKKRSYISNQHTFYTAIVFSEKINRWKFMYRNLLQAQYEDLYVSKYGLLPKIFDRNKITIKYEATKRFSFYLAEEIYIALKNPLAKGITRSRSFAGMFIQTARHQELELYFCLQAEIQKVEWYKQSAYYNNLPYSRGYIYGIGYCFEF